MDAFLEEVTHIMVKWNGIYMFEQDSAPNKVCCCITKAVKSEQEFYTDRIKTHEEGSFLRKNCMQQSGFGKVVVEVKALMKTKTERKLSFQNLVGVSYRA